MLTHARKKPTHPHVLMSYSKVGYGYACGVFRTLEQRRVEKQSSESDQDTSEPSMIDATISFSPASYKNRKKPQPSHVMGFLSVYMCESQPQRVNIYIYI